MKWFHRHTFDPEKWKLLDSADWHATDRFTGIMSPGIIFTVKTFTNQCLTCGDLFIKKIKT